MQKYHQDMGNLNVDKDSVCRFTQMILLLEMRGYLSSFKVSVS